MCRVGGPKGKDIGAGMVSEGWALGYRKNSFDYVAAEDTARKAGLAEVKELERMEPKGAVHYRRNDR